MYGYVLQLAKINHYLRIHPDIEELLTREVNMIEANTTSGGPNTLSRLDGFEKQLEERETLLKQKEIILLRPRLVRTKS
jgi:hypothetical protein